MAEGTILIENARIVFRNFEGKEGPYNRAGDRNFCVLLDDDLAGQLLADGWNIKALRAREDDEPEQPYIQVSVGFKVRPPKMVMIGSISRTRNELDEDSCAVLDWVDIRTVDLIIRPYHWVVREDSGIKAYLQTIYVTVEEDFLDLKYSDLEQLPASGGKIIDD